MEITHRIPKFNSEALKSLDTKSLKSSLRQPLQEMKILIVNCMWSWGSFEISILKILIWAQLKFWKFWSDMIAFHMQLLHIELCWLFMWLLHRQNETFQNSIYWSPTYILQWHKKSITIWLWKDWGPRRRGWIGTFSNFYRVLNID